MYSEIIERWEAESEEFYSPIEHWACASFPLSDNHKYMAMLTAYFDESGHEDDPNSRIGGMAGCITTAQDWMRFEKDWQRVLDRAGIQFFHMKDYAHSTGEFKDGWKGDKPKRDALYGELWNVIERTNPIFFGCFVPLDVYRQALTPIQRKRLSAYFATYQHCMASIFGLFHSEFGPKIVRIVTYFDDKPGVRRDVNGFYDHIIKVHDYFGRIPPPAFDNMRVLVPLQLADVVAYESSKEYDRQLHNPSKTPRWGFTKLEEIIQRSIRPELKLTLGSEDSPIVFRSAEWVESIAAVYDDLLEDV